MRTKTARTDIRIEFPSQGATYSREVFGVYEYGTYPRSSVLSGQQKRVFLQSFKTLAEAKAAYPAVKTIDSPRYQVPFLNHLDGEDL